MKLRISRKPVVLALLLCLALSAVIIPFAAHLPRWIEAELVVGVWWLIWFGLLTLFLYRGVAVDDDCRWTPLQPSQFSSADVAAGCLDVGSTGGCFGGCGDVMAGISVLALLIAGILLAVEFLLPALALVLLASMGGMVARAVNDRHDCEGHLGRSLGWAVVWSTLYLGPIAALAAWLPILLSKS